MSDFLLHDVYHHFQGNCAEKLVSGSDDFTLFLWEPENNKNSIARMTGEEFCVWGNNDSIEMCI